MAMRPAHETLKRDGNLKITVDETYKPRQDFNFRTPVAISQEKRSDETYDPKIKGRTILEIEDRKKDKTVRVAVKFGLSADDITMQYHPEVRNDEGQVVFKEQLSLADVNASNMQIEPLGIDPANYDTLSKFQARDAIEEYKSEIQDTLKDLTLSQTEDLDRLKNPSQYKGPSADTIPYKMLAENSEKLAEREVMSIDRAFGMSTRHNSHDVNEPKVMYLDRYPYEGLFEEGEISANERLKLRGEQLNNDADFEAKAKLYGLNEDSKRVFAKNPLQQTLLEEIRRVEPPFSDAEKRLMVVTDNWNEPTLTKVAVNLSDKMETMVDKLQNIDENSNDNPYAMIAENKAEITDMLLKATGIEDPKQIEAIENAVSNIHQQELMTKLVGAEIRAELNSSNIGYDDDGYYDGEEYDYNYDQYESMLSEQITQSWKDKLDSYEKDYLQSKKVNDSTVSVDNTARKIAWREPPKQLKNVSASQLSKIEYTDEYYEAKAKQYGLSEDSDIVRFKNNNELQEKLLGAIRQVEPPLSDAEMRLMVVTDNWSEPTLTKLSNLSSIDVTGKMQQSLFDAIEQKEDRDNTYGMIDAKAQEFTQILFKDAQITDPNQTEVLKDTVYELYEELVVDHAVQVEAITKIIPSYNNNRENSSLDDLQKISVADFNDMCDEAYDEIKEERTAYYKQALDEEKREYLSNNKQMNLSDDLDELGVDVALMDVDTALAKMEDIMNNQAIDIADNTMDNTQTVNNDNNYDNFVPPPIGP